jgi:ATPases involved in chromosome partitioning
MGRVVAIANQKGGVAKTTTAANLGAALHEAGCRVLLVDMDPQASLTVWSGRNPDDLDKTTYDALVKDADARDILLPTPLGPDLLPANIDLSLAEMELIHAYNRERRLAGMLAPVRDEYDFILLDCPAVARSDHQRLRRG